MTLFRLCAMDGSRETSIMYGRHLAWSSERADRRSPRGMSRKEAEVIPNSGVLEGAS